MTVPWTVLTNYHKNCSLITTSIIKHFKLFFKITPSAQNRFFIVYARTHARAHTHARTPARARAGNRYDEVRRLQRLRHLFNNQRIGIRLAVGTDILIYSRLPTMALGPTQPPTKLVREAQYSGVERPQRGA
jgi:hypothetical protein